MNKAPVAHHVTTETDRHVLRTAAHSSSRSLVDPLKVALNALVEARSDVLSPQSHDSELDVHEVGRP
jgi:hypothetical protein